MPALQLTRVVHRADHRFCRNTAVGDDERVQRCGDVPGLQRIDQPLEVSRILLLRVLPEPQAAVGGEPALKVRRLVLRRVGLVEVVVEHLGERDRVLVSCRRPEVVRVIVRRHEDALVIGQGAAWDRDRERDQDEDEFRAAPQAGSNCLLQSFVLKRGPHWWFINVGTRRFQIRLRRNCSASKLRRRVRRAKAAEPGSARREPPARGRRVRPARFELATSASAGQRSIP